MNDLNPLYPDARVPLRFLIDKFTHEELKSSGLEVRIIREHSLRSYYFIQERSSRDPRRGLGQLDFSRFLRMQLSGPDPFFVKYPYYIIELNINNRVSFENHIRYTKKTTLH